MKYFTIITSFILFFPTVLFSQNRNFFNRDVILYTPIIDVVNSGNIISVAPSVSSDNKYVSLTVNAVSTNVVEIKSVEGFFKFKGIENSILEKKGMSRIE